MYIAISEENRIELEELREEVIQIKQEAIELSVSILIQLKTFMFQFLLSYKEYSLTNIREYGLVEILMNRAMRFFKLDNDEERPKKTKEKTKSKFRFRIKAKSTNVQTKTQVKSFIKAQSNSKTRRGYKYIFKRSIKLILFPIYLLILIFGILLESKSNESSGKNVKNTYKPY